MTPDGLMRKPRSRMVPPPTPLLTCPGLRYWAPHFGTPYLVFVDESFRGFFEFREHGYFAHGLVGIPESQYDGMKAAVAPVFEEYRHLTSAGQREIKHTEFKRLAYRDRRRLSMKIRNALKTHGAFINVFYSPLRSFVLEHVRTRLFHARKREIPTDFNALYTEAAEHIKSEREGPGQSALIQRLLFLPISAVANMLATFGSSFTVVYDPREKREDKTVIAAIDGALAALRNLKNKDAAMRWDLHNFVKGFVHDRRSEDEIGLQMADLIVGETRAFFDANPEQMEIAASRKLITQTSYEPCVTVESIQGQMYKTGALNRIPAAVRKKWLVQDRQGRTVLPLFGSFSALVLQPAIPAGVSLGTSQSSTGTYSTSWNDRRHPSRAPAEAFARSRGAFQRLVVDEALDDAWRSNAIEHADTSTRTGNRLAAAVGVLDPTCGSGTFLYHAARRILDAPEIRKHTAVRQADITASLVHGIDVHPG